MHKNCFSFVSDILFSADQNIALTSKNGSIYITGSDGVYIDLNNIPIIQVEHGIRTVGTQYKLCICYNGKLFKVPIHLHKSGCIISSNYDPCSI